MRYLFLYWQTVLAFVAILAVFALCGLLVSFVVVWMVSTFEPSTVGLAAGGMVFACLLGRFVRHMRD